MVGLKKISEPVFCRCTPFADEYLLGALDLLTHLTGHPLRISDAIHALGDCAYA